MFFVRETHVLDCGASHLALGAFARGAQGRLQISTCATERLPVEPGREEDWLPQVTEALQRLRPAIKSPRPLTVVLPPHLTLLKFVRAPRVAAARRARVLQFEAQQVIPYAINEVIWDAVRNGAVGDEDEFMLCAAKRDAIEALCATIEAAGFRVRQLVPSALTTLAASRMANGVASPVLLLNLGARSTSLVLSGPDGFHARTLPLGGHGITQQIAANQDCDFAEAEALKISGQNPLLNEAAAEGQFIRLAQEITRTVLHFQRESGAPKPVEVLCTGGASATPGIRPLLASRLNIAVRPFPAGAAFEVGFVEQRLDVPADLIGGAALDFDRTLPRCDLLPSARKQRELRRRRLPWLALAAALAAAALLPVLMHYRAIMVAARHKTSAIDRELAPLRARAGRNRENLARLDAAQRELAALRQMQTRRAAWLRFFADLQERLAAAEDVWLDRMQLLPATQGESPAPRLAIAGRMLAGDGAETRMKTLLASLSSSPWVAGLEAERFDRDQPGLLRFDFVLTMVTPPVR